MNDKLPVAKPRTEREMAESYLVRHHADAEVFDALDLWPDVACVKASADPKPSTARRHRGERICDRCNQWAPVGAYPRGGGVCRSCMTAAVREARRAAA